MIILVVNIFFVQFFCVFFCYLFLISSASVRSIPFLSFIEPIFAWNVPLVSNFLEEISSLSHSVVFLYFFALIVEEDFLFSPCILWNSAFRCLYLSFSPLHFTSLLFISICKASPDNHLYSPWTSLGQNTGVGSLSLLQGIFLTQELNRGLLHCRQILYQLSYQGSQN